MADAFIGEIRLVPYYHTFPPKGWMFCNGSLLKISEYQALYALIGTTYGGDGIKEFALPDLRGSVLVGQGNGVGLTPRPMGQTGGSERVVLNESQMPSHNHLFCATSQDNTSQTPGGLLFGSDDSGTYKRYIAPIPTSPAPKYLLLDETTIQQTGGSQAHSNLMAGLSLNYIICITAGIFPERS